MTCAITLDKNTTKGLTVQGALQEIYVQGTATGCASVRVTVTCGSVAIPSVTVQVAGGTWFHTFKSLPQSCSCGGQVRIRAECTESGNACVNADWDQPSDLPCKAKGPVVPPCATFTPQLQVGPCKSDGTRDVTVSFTVIASGTSTVELRDGANQVLATQTGPSPLTISHSLSLPEGSNQTFHAVVTHGGCLGWTSAATLVVPACGSPGGKTVTIGNGPLKTPGPFEKTPPPKKPGDPPRVTTPPTESSCGSMVWVVGSLLAVAGALTALTLAWQLCRPPMPPWFWLVPAGAGLLAGIAIAVWYIVCKLVASCPCPTKCDWLQIGVMSTLGSAGVAAWLIPCCPWFWAVATGLGAAYTAALTAWLIACKPDICVVLGAHLTALGSAAAPTLTYLALSPLYTCGWTVVNTAITTIVALLAVGTVAKCIQKANKP